MISVFIQFRETPSDENNKFTLDFSDEEFVQETDIQKTNIILLA